MVRFAIWSDPVVLMQNYKPAKGDRHAIMRKILNTGLIR
jgi:hypothetical protein